MDFGASSPRSTFSSSTDASPERLSLPPFYIFSFLSPFAASASLPSLTSPLGASAVLAGKEVVDWSTCPICLQVLCRPVCGPCQHVACGGCFVGSLQWRQKCPVCNRAMKASDLECMRSPDASNGRSEATSREEQSSSSSQPPSSLSAPDPSSSLASPSRRPSDRSAPPLAGAADVGPPPTATAAVCAQPPRQRSLGTSPAVATTAAAAAAAVSAAAAATVTATLAGGTDAAVNAAGDVKDGASAAATVISAVLSSDELEAGEEEVPREARAARAATARSAGTQGEGGEREDPQSAAFGGDGTDENAMIARVQKLLEEERRRELAKKTEETRGQGNGDRASETEPPGLESREEQIIRMCDSYYERVLAARDGRKSEVSSSFSSSALGSSFASAVSVTSTLYWRLLLRCDLCGEVVAMHRYDAHRRSSCAYRRCRFFPFGCEFVAKVEGSVAPLVATSSLPVSAIAAPSSLFASAVAPASTASSSEPPSRNALQLRVHEHRCPYRLVKCPCCWKYSTERSSSVLVPLTQLAKLQGSRAPVPPRQPSGPSSPFDSHERGDSEEPRLASQGSQEKEEETREEGAREEEAREVSGNLPDVHAESREGDGREFGGVLPSSHATREGRETPSQEELVHLLILQQQDLPRDDDADRRWFSVQRDPSSLFSSAEVEDVDLTEPVGRVVFEDLQGAMDYLLDTEEDIENRIERYGMEPKAFMSEQDRLLVCSPDCIVKEPQRLRVELHEALALLGVTWAVGFPLAFLLGAASSFWGQKTAAFLDIAVPYFFSIVSGWLTGFLRQRPAAGFSLQNE
ncbi:putative transmembrane protein [Toxoplasma gondii p89]|uniref:Putative transmembrane protein n=1 Tax=Toxoplasma gondii p89 TaxID=943119 RepID=A0A086L371_TOXGO|nr:putative transmembrane protein [Toxoplasma gondii p89]